MMRRIAAVLFFLFAFTASNAIHAQRSKKVFLNQDNEVILRGKYKKLLVKANGKLLDICITDTDTLKVRKLFWREHQGKLHTIALSQLKEYLMETSGKNIPDADYIVVNYYPGKDSCNAPFFEKTELKSYLSSLQAYEEAILSLKNVSRFYFTNRQKPNPFEKTEITVYPDGSNIFKNMFFPYAFPCGSFVVIHPDGRYIKYYGEYHNQIILDILQADWELDFFWD